ncbi:MAG: M24 family metallopeptidase [Phycisphaerales bacterium]|nr:MAG: M24 family metallopeptidase [Phycisphaerales bacterium]
MQETHALPEPDFAARRDRIARAIQQAAGDAIVLIGAGEPIPVPGGLDRVHRFNTHPDYWFLTGEHRPGGVIAYDPQSAPAATPADAWTAFSVPQSAAERTWEGEADVPGVPIAELSAWLAARRGRPVAMLGCPLPGVRADDAQTRRLADLVWHARRVKDDAEVARIRRAAAITARTFADLPNHIRPGVTERELRNRILSGFIGAGADGEGYDTIVGVGANAAVLHFTPGSKAAGERDFILIDAGAEQARYTADVTRTFPVTPGNVSTVQRDFYNTVLSAQAQAVANCKPGVEFHDLHRQAAEAIGAGLVAMGLLKGDPPELVDHGVMRLFFPHGLGHLVGLGVRDASGRLPGRVHRPGPGGTNIRLDLPLQPGYCVTIEPGLYLVPALIDDPATRERFVDAVRWSEIDKVRKEIQGVRIEDDVLVTDAEPDVLTAEISKQL